ncbi:MAG: hypothetical protein ACE1Z8_04735, partial [Candidatus Acidiferrales bacterium]
ASGFGQCCAWTAPQQASGFGQCCAWTAPQQASGFGQCCARPELHRAQKTRWHALLTKQDAVKSPRWLSEHHHDPNLYRSGPTVL